MEKMTTLKYQSLSSGLGTTGIILGIMTLLFSLIPILGMLALLLGFIALIVIGIGFAVAIKQGHPKSKLMTALILTSIGTGISLMQFSTFG